MARELARLFGLVGMVAAAQTGCSLGAGHGKSEIADDSAPAPSSSPARSDDGADATPPPFDFGALDAGGADAIAQDAGPPPVPPGSVAWGLDDQNTLVRFEVANPATVTTQPVTGLGANETLLGIDFRPATSVMYGISDATILYTINPTSGAATAVGTSALPGVMGQAHGLDFDPVMDRIRVQTDVDQNLRVDPETGKVTADTTLAFALKDPNYGQSPNLVGTAYSNSVTPAPTSTALYALDSTRNELVKLASPTSGQISTIGALGVDFDQEAGFDIWGKDGTQKAYAALRVAGVTGFYDVDLGTGAAKLVAPIGYPRALVGIAILP